MNRRKPQVATTFRLCTYPSCQAVVSDRLRCATCNIATYCRLLHQSLDIERHKLECRASRKPRRRPTPVEVRKVDFLLFPTNASTPYVIQADCRVRASSEYGGEQQHDVDWNTYFGGPVPLTSQPVGPAQRSSRGAPSTRLYLAFSDSFATDGSPPNLCARKLTGGRSHVEWAGVLIGYRAREPAEHLTQFFDVDMSDLHSFVAFLKNHGSSVPRSPSIRVLQLDELKAIVAWLSGRNAYSEAFSASGSAPTGRAPRERMMPNAYPTTPCPETQEEPEEAWERTVEGSGAPEETLVLTVEEMKFAVWEALTCYILVLFILYGLWRFVLPPALTLFWAAFRTVLSVIDRALDIVDRAIWPIALLTFIL